MSAVLGPTILSGSCWPRCSVSIRIHGINWIIKKYAFSQKQSSLNIISRKPRTAWAVARPIFVRSLTWLLVRYVLVLVSLMIRIPFRPIIITLVRSLVRSRSFAGSSSPDLNENFLRSIGSIQDIITDSNKVSCTLWLRNFWTRSYAPYTLRCEKKDF